MMIYGNIIILQRMFGLGSGVMKWYPWYCF